MMIEGDREADQEHTQRRPRWARPFRFGIGSMGRGW